MSFFQTDQCQQDRVHQARHFLGTCISQPFVSFHSEYISLLQVFSDENFWSFLRKIGFLKCELSYLLFMMYLQSGSNVHWKYKPSDMWYDMFDIKSCVSTVTLFQPPSKYNEIWIIHCIPGRSMTTTSKLYQMALSPTWLLYKHCEYQIFLQDLAFYFITDFSGWQTFLVKDLLIFTDL